VRSACSSCGQSFFAHACGIDHAMVAAWMLAERRRIRRAIAPALRELRSRCRIAKDDRPGDYAMALAILDRATKAPKRTGK
jgi:hypothetical protein